MSDLGIWKQGTGYVIRVYGSEVFITREDFDELRGHLEAIRMGAEESLSEGYKALKKYERVYDPAKVRTVVKPATIDDLLF